MVNGKCLKEKSPLKYCAKFCIYQNKKIYKINKKDKTPVLFLPIIMLETGMNFEAT